MAITEKQKKFAEEYLIDLNATQAAIRAGYSPKRASELQECAQMVSELDDKMLSLNEAIQACLEVENTPVPVELVKENQEQEKKQEDIVEHILGKES